MNKFFEKIIDIPKTLYFNFYYLPFEKAIKLPLYVSHTIKIKNMGKRGSLYLNEVKRGIVKIGVSKGSYSLGIGQTGWWNIDSSARVVFKGSANMARGVNIEVSPNAVLEIGNQFFCNANTIISSNKHIKFGDDILIGWNCVFIDGDGHQIVDLDENLLNVSRKIEIGNHVWFASYSSVLKGSKVPDNTIVAFKANVSGKFETGNSILGGNPATEIKNNVNWKHDRI